MFRHGKNLNSDMWRQMQLWKATANQAHPFSKFATGSYETLMSTPKVGNASMACDLHISSGHCRRPVLAALTGH